MRLTADILLQKTVDIEEVRKVFPYGQTKFEVHFVACLYVPQAHVVATVYYILCCTRALMCLKSVSVVVRQT